MWLSPSAHPDVRAVAVHNEALAMLRRAVAQDVADREPPLPSSAMPLAPVIELPILEPTGVELPGRDEFEAALDDADVRRHGRARSSVPTNRSRTPVRNAIGARLPSVDPQARPRRDHSTIRPSRVLLVDIDRRTAFEVSKRLRAELAEPLLTPSGVSELTYSVGLAHEDGLPDTQELYESAQGAMEGARNEGGARMLVAS